jgi:hypothetical protein
MKDSCFLLIFTKKQTCRFHAYIAYIHQLSVTMIFHLLNILIDTPGRATLIIYSYDLINWYN